MDSLLSAELCTPRLLLRTLRSSDAQALFEIHADEQAMRHANSEGWRSLDQAHGLINQSIEWRQSGRHICFGVEQRDAQRLLGTCTLYDIDHANQRAEVGFILGRFAWGQGFMAEALAAVLDLAFGRLGMNRIEADTAPGNHQAIKLLEKAGFTMEGVLRERWVTNGSRSDSVIFGLLRAQWSRPPAMTEGGGA